jgi:Holliday junction resolvase RusA-like endonuclease
MTLQLTLDIPPGTNNLYTDGRNGRRILTSVARDYKERTTLIAHIVALSANWRYQRGQRLAVTISLYFKDNRRRDIANCEKAVIDAISEALGFDDCVIDRLTLERAGIDKARPRCEVAIRAI